MHRSHCGRKDTKDVHCHAKAEFMLARILAAVKCYGAREQVKLLVRNRYKSVAYLSRKWAYLANTL